MPGYLNKLLCLLAGFLCLVSFARQGEAYTTVDLGSAGYSYSSVPQVSKLATDKNGVIWQANLTFNTSQERWYFNIASTNGSSLPNNIASYNLGLSDNYSGSVVSIAVDGNNAKWIALSLYRGSSAYYNYIFEYNGSFSQRDYNTTSNSYTGMGIDPSDGRVIVATKDKSVKKWNGGSWVSWPAAAWTTGGVKGFTADNNNVLWAWSGSGETATWNGSSWVSKGTVPGGCAKLIINPATGSVGAFNRNSVYEYNGSGWVYRQAINNGDYGGCYAIDGAVIDGYYYSAGGGSGGCVAYYFDTLPLSDGSIYILHYQVDTECTEGCWSTTTYSAKKHVFNTSSFALTPSPSGANGQLRLSDRFDGRNVGGAMLQYSTDGSGYADLRTMQNGDGGVVTPTANNYWFRLKWYHRYHPANPVNTLFTNAVSVPTITAAPSISHTTGIEQWDAARGRSWANLAWGPVGNASGYNLQIFDGNDYRARNIGNVTAWNSQAARVFPQAVNLPEDNSISSDPFRWDGSGTGLEDTAARLYRSTTGTGYDAVKGYYFKVSAYNAWMESTTSLIYVELPNATDFLPPAGTISVTVPDDATAPATVGVDLSAVTDNSNGSGLYQMRFSNDNAAWSEWENFAVSRSWSTSSGEGQKTVYAQAKDNVGNTTTLSVSFWLGATLTQIYNEAQNSSQKTEAARQAAIDAKASSEAALTAAQAASTNAGLAAANAQTAAHQTNYTGKYGGDAESVADISGYIRNTQLPEINSKTDSIQNAVNAINSTVTSINSTVSADTAAPAVRIKTVSGAGATSGSFIRAVINATDNISTVFVYSLDGTAYEPLPADGVVDLPVNSPGTNLITVWLKDEAGNVGRESITIRKF